MRVQFDRVVKQECYTEVWQLRKLQLHNTEEEGSSY